MHRISVLLPVHRAVHPDHFSRALESLKQQTRLADELVLVEDGPLTDQLRAVMETYDPSPMEVVRVVLPENRGAGVANDAGLRAATGDLIAKMDADDVALPERFEKQERYLERGGLDVCGTAMLQFADSESDFIRVRRRPLTHRSIARRMKVNNPMNHPTTMYRRSLAVASGGYGDLRFMQDYDLFARMLTNGAVFGNLANPLVAFRADEGFYRRRTSPAMQECEILLQRRLISYGLISPLRGRVQYVLRATARRLPPRIVKRMYVLADRYL